MTNKFKIGLLIATILAALIHLSMLVIFTTKYDHSTNTLLLSVIPILPYAILSIIFIKFPELLGKILLSVLSLLFIIFIGFFIYMIFVLKGVYFTMLIFGLGGIMLIPESVLLHGFINVNIILLTISLLPYALTIFMLLTLCQKLRDALIFTAGLLLIVLFLYPLYDVLFIQNADAQGAFVYPIVLGFQTFACFFIGTILGAIHLANFIHKKYCHCEGVGDKAIQK